MMGKILKHSGQGAATEHGTEQVTAQSDGDLVLFQ